MITSERLNAPSGAQCFPTGKSPVSVPTVTAGLNAPSGAQCFPTLSGAGDVFQIDVSMHLLVLSAFRLRPQKTVPQRRLPERNRRRPGKHHIESARTVQLNHTTAKNRHKPPQRRRCPLPASTPPTFNEPKPKNRPLTTTPELTSSYWASRIPCCKVMTILPAEKPIQVYTEIKITRKHQIENQQHRIGDWVLLCVNDAETHTRLIKG